MDLKSYKVNLYSILKLKLKNMPYILQAKDESLQYGNYYYSAITCYQWHIITYCGPRKIIEQIQR